MSDPITTSAGLLASKGIAIIYALGGALLTLAFYEPINKTQPRWKMFLISLGNVAMSCFAGYTIGSAVNEYFVLHGAIANLIYSASGLVGLVIVGMAYRLVQNFKDNPESAIKLWMGRGK